MKLFLTSAGFTTKTLQDTFVREVAKEKLQPSVLLVVHSKNEIELGYTKETEAGLRKLGFNNISTFNLYTPTTIRELKDFDVIYVSGGNTFTILKAIRETKIDKFIVSQVKKGAIYVGVSAGSIIAGPSIEIAGWGSEGDINEVGLKDLKGFKLTNTAVFPHFREELRKEVDEIKGKVSYPIIELTDNQALVTVDGRLNFLVQ